MVKVFLVRPTGKFPGQTQILNRKSRFAGWDVPLPVTSYLSFVLQSTLALRTPRYYGQPANADKSQPSGETHKEMTETNSDTFLPLSATVHLFFSLAVADI